MLVIVGSGEYLPRMEPVDSELIRRLGEPARVVCLPTAAGLEGDERIHYWSQLGIDHFTQLGATAEALPVIDHASAQNVAYAKRIEAANFVYLSGGNPAHLYDSLNNTPVWDAIKGVLDRGGVVAGCSAGAMIMGEKFFGFPGWHTGFNFLPRVTVIPHFDEISDRILGMVNPIRSVFANSLTLVGVDGYTGLVKTGSGSDARYEVLGTGGVTVWNNAQKTRYTQGALPTGIF